jgi:hypothetical protein
MKAKEMVRYTFTVRGKVTVTLPGTDTNLNYEIAREMAVQLASEKIDDNWIGSIDDNAAEELTDYEEEEEDVRHGFEDWEIDPEMGTHG